MTITEWRNKLKKAVNKMARVGMELTIDGKVFHCIGTEESSWGTRFVFDNGISWTVNNICSNIERCQVNGLEWNLK